MNRRERRQSIAVHTFDDALVPVIVELVDQLGTVKPVNELHRQLHRPRLRQADRYPWDLKVDL